MIIFLRSAISTAIKLLLKIILHMVDELSDKLFSLWGSIKQFLYILFPITLNSNQPPVSPDCSGRAEA